MEWVNDLLSTFIVVIIKRKNGDEWLWFLYVSTINILIEREIKRTIDRKIIKGFIGNARVQFIDDVFDRMCYGE